MCQANVVAHSCGHLETHDDPSDVLPCSLMLQSPRPRSLSANKGTQTDYGILTYVQIPSFMACRDCVEKLKDELAALPCALRSKSQISACGSAGVGAQEANNSSNQEEQSSTEERPATESSECNEIPDAIADAMANCIFGNDTLFTNMRVGPSEGVALAMLGLAPLAEVEPAAAMLGLAAFAEPAVLGLTPFAGPEPALLGLAPCAEVVTLEDWDGNSQPPSANPSEVAPSVVAEEPQDDTEDTPDCAADPQACEGPDITKGWCVVQTGGTSVVGLEVEAAAAPSGNCDDSFIIINDEEAASPEFNLQMWAESSGRNILVNCLPKTLRVLLPW